MIHGETFDSYIREDLAMYRCGNCGEQFSESTRRKMFREHLPCPCGEQAGEFSLVDTFLNPDLAERTPMHWDTVVRLVTESGMWRCNACYYTADEDLWIREGFGHDEFFTTCPRCRQVEDYEVLRIK